MTGPTITPTRTDPDAYMRKPEGADLIAPAQAAEGDAPGVAGLNLPPRPIEAASLSTANPAAPSYDPDMDVR